MSGVKKYVLCFLLGNLKYKGRVYCKNVVHEGNDSPKSEKIVKKVVREKDGSSKKTPIFWLNRIYYKKEVL